MKATLNKTNKSYELNDIPQLILNEDGVYLMTSILSSLFFTISLGLIL